jgi:uncharacterized protein (DUF2141 family)
MIRPCAALSLLLVTAASQPATQASAELSVSVEGLRNAKGVVHFCLTQAASRFLDCQKDPRASKMTLPAARAGHLSFQDVGPGSYALLAFHDENRNNKLDMMLGIPREGFGFSNNPTIRMRAPTYQEVRFTMPSGRLSQTIRFKYVL